MTLAPENKDWTNAPPSFDVKRARAWARGYKDAIADITPQWRPIENWDGKHDWVVYARRDPAGHWGHVSFPWQATHFMQLTPPERNHDAH